MLDRSTPTLQPPAFPALVDRRQYDELLAEVRSLRDIITKMEQWCFILDVDLTSVQDRLRRGSHS